MPPASPPRSPSKSSKISRRDVAKLTPTSLDNSNAVHADVLYWLYHHILPGITPKFLRKFIANKDVRTLVLLLPEERVKEDDSVSPSESDEDDEEEDDTNKPRSPGGADYEEAVDDGFNDDDESDDSEDDDGAGPSASSDPAARAALKRRLLGAVSYELGERLGQRLVQVSLLGVRLRYQKLGVGARLVRTLLNGEASAERPDAAIAWADTKAIEFFKRHGFTDDPMLNARYREVSAPWVRSTLMSAQLIPPIPDLSGNASSSTAVSNWAAAGHLDEKLDAWRKSRLLEYSNELSLIERYMVEIRMLREKVVTQQGHVNVLQVENAKLRRENQTLQTEFDEYRKARGGGGGGGVHRMPPIDVSSASEAAAAAENGAASVAADVDAFIAAAEAEAAAEMAASRGSSVAASPARRTGAAAAAATSPSSPKPRWQAGSRGNDGGGNGGEPAGGGGGTAMTFEECQRELSKCKPSAIGTDTGLKLTRFVVPPASGLTRMKRRHEACRAMLTEPSLALRLFYGAPLSELQQLLERGFEEVPSAEGDPLGLRAFGRGFYFSKYAAHAHHYTGGSGCVLLAEVAVGNAETVVKRDARRGAPSPGYDSIVVPGRRLPSQGDGGGAEVNEEYVIFDGSQALPLALIYYDHA